ncbi:MAG TPA: Stk1 family PASTA domain-containing Ser/Thr kinase [Candidatus Acetatifactor stercoripullorum]|uniref:non-specific serine/threonine protein kinase n=1 Tax=Candidatus Acetatifactor stercoripullorum TaxID=2838414 RepID=A0A9D1R5M3_9FIRM|nr:Stk1 family PASTA domain-containing Ser/Thr kinase [Candidatus Acetatifactor stercoripullorum]HIW81948.1 Stk1 family PASTA domain-containing Ser/Thr kinase [Candidatus Acetatifactor stercoripullorum]
MIKIGMMIGDRYEILEKIGTGGMSDVYKAKCHKLNRYVAVKVLKQEFSENANFVSKFRIEAQAAAGLMHPNIVNVYDVGEENGIYYIVMELVEGITLKKYIEKKARLSYKEAVSIAIQVSMGIEAAHNNHIIHRDIKPQNIIISKDGKVKVTDFGIAKAATSNTITSNVMGSVHYTSPEQARGGYSDEKSDIYSLGITMFEMLTGRVPFNGETTVAIAIKHIQEEMPSPKEFVPEIPASVESIVLKCCQKSPDRRYQNMQELIADLKQSLISPDEDFVVMRDMDESARTRMISDNDMAQIKRRSVYQENEEHLKRQDSMRLRTEADPDYDEEEEEEDEYDYNPRMEKVTTALAVIVGVVICAVIIFLAVRIFGGMQDENRQSPIITTEETQTSAAYVQMPDVRGMNVEDARNSLTELGLNPQVEYQESDTYDEGVVISADVSVGASLEAGSTVTLTVSAGSEGVEVPGVTGKTFDEANSELIGLGFLVNKTESYSDTIEAGIVISQNPANGSKAPRGSVITVTVSLGKEETKVRVPNLIGLSEEDGTFEAIEAGLEIGSVSYVYNAEVQEGHICYQSYSHGSYVDPGTSLDIKVSQGAEPVTYKCNMSITAPTVEEAPDYVAGTEVTIRLETDDGQVLLETTTSTFPQSANYYGLTSSGGTITMTYTVTTEGGTTTDPETGETVSTPGVTESRSFTRRVEFVAE